MQNYIQTAIAKTKHYLILGKIWYQSLDKKKKFILMLYVGCAAVLFVGTLAIIISSVLQTEKFNNQAKLEAFLNRIQAVNNKYENLTQLYSYNNLDEEKKQLKIDFEGKAKELEANKELIKKLPISDPIIE